MDTTISKNNKIFTFFLLFIVADLCANGGPYEVTALRELGEIQLTNADGIQLLKEDLSFKIQGDTVYTRVLYTFENVENTDKNIDYAFPVDFLKTWVMDDAPHIKASPLFSLSFSLNDSMLFAHREHLTNGNNSTQGMQISLEKTKDTSMIVRLWHTTSFTLPAQSKSMLEVSYGIAANIDDAQSSKQIYPHFGPRTIIWDFSPAVFWGKGMVENLTVSVDASFIKAVGGKITFEGLDFEKSNERYTFSTRYFDFQKSKPMKISYSYAHFLESKYFFDRLCCSAPPDQYVDISSSSFRAGDIPQNILDGNLETVWSEGSAGDGVGEWIQLEFLHPNRFILAHLIPACITSESCYTEQNRIKKLEIMKRFSDGKTEIKTITLDDKQFVEKMDDQVNIRHYALDIDLMNVSKVRFTIKEVYDGTGDMTSISEILVYAHPELVY